MIAEVLEIFEHKEKILVGHSLGGSVVSRLVMDYPELVSSMILVAPSIDPDQEKYEWYRSWIDTWLGGVITPTALWVSNKEIIALKAELQKMIPFWSKIQCSTIVIQGTNDMLVPKENAEFARCMIQDSLIEIKYLEGVNHFIPWTNPESILQAIWDHSE